MSSDVVADSVTIDGVLVGDVRIPESTAELSDVLREVTADGLHSAIVGGGTRLAFGNLGGPFDVAISMRKLNRVIAYEPDNMTMAVEPGCTIAQIHDVLAAERQSMALDAARPERSTIGGAYCAGMSGPRRLGGGSLKDWVIGVEVAGPDGTVAKAGGMVVKNVTGFDMMHLHYGALGAFGVVTRLNLKVFPAASASRSIELRYASAATAHSAAVALLRSQLLPASVLCWNDGDSWCVSVRCDAPEGAIDRLANRMLDLATDAATAETAVAMSDGSVALQPFTSLVELTSGDIIVRLPLVASRQTPVIHELADAGWRVCADLGSGLVYARRPAGDGVEDMRPELAGAATWLALPASLKTGRDVFGPTPEAVGPILQRLKNSFDPDRRINSGRFVLGL